MRRRFMNGDKGVYEPSQAPYGIYIVHIDGLVYESSAWLNANLDNKDVVGLGVKTENCSFIMSLFEDTSIKWGDKKLVSGCKAIRDKSTAMSDYDGQKNTDAIISYFSSSWSTTYAAKYCRNYIFKNGQAGYLPASGELYEASKFYAEVNDLLYILGGNDMYDSYKDNYLKWCSTQLDDRDAWYLMWGSRPDDITLDSSTKSDSNSHCCARPFTVFQ